MAVKTVVAHDVALAEFEDFAENFDIDVDASAMDADELAEFETLRDKVVRAVMRGALTFAETGEPVFVPQRTPNHEPITFYEPNGAALMDDKSKKGGGDVGRAYRVLANMTKTSPGTFANMKMADVNVCTAIMTLFLGA